MEINVSQSGSVFHFIFYFWQNSIWFLFLDWKNKVNNFLRDYIRSEELGNCLSYYSDLVGLSGLLLGDDFLVRLDRLIHFSVVLGSLHYCLTGHFLIISVTRVS